MVLLFLSKPDSQYSNSTTKRIEFNQFIGVVDITGKEVLPGIENPTAIPRRFYLNTMSP